MTIIMEQHALDALIAKAVATEREECAKICNDMCWAGRSSYAQDKNDAADECAEAIRARKD